MNSRLSLALFACLAALLAAGRAHAHWQTQSFDLKAGWNAVFLENIFATPLSSFSRSFALSVTA